MKKGLSLFLSLVPVASFAATLPSPSTGPVANVDYVHRAINQKWGIGYQPVAAAAPYAVNMEYLLGAIDAANEILNGKAITNYANTEYATKYAANTVVVDYAVANMVRDEGFYVEYNGDEAAMIISAAGNFVIDWGDDAPESCQRNITKNVGATEYTCEYGTSGIHKVRLSGTATGYSTGTGDGDAAFSLYKIDSGIRKSVVNISGCLGCVFPTIGDGDTTSNQPMFHSAFRGLTSMTTDIASLHDLFNGVHGAPRQRMFSHLFYQSAVSGVIPTMFAGITGAPVEDMFYRTFSDCKNITGIGGALFAGISGKPQTRMFAEVFYKSANLSGTIPLNLFGTYTSTDVKTTGSNMFQRVFSGCSKLTGDSAKVSVDGTPTYLYNIWSSGGSDAYNGATGLADYDSIPSSWL